MTSTHDTQSQTATAIYESPNEWALFTTHDVLSAPEFSIAIEEYRRTQDLLLLAQVRVDPWTPDVLNALRAAWETLRAQTDLPLFTCADGDNAERDDFIISLGFQPVGEFACTDDVTRRLYLSVAV